MLATLFSNPMVFVLWALAVIYAITTHEFSHVLMARLLGDDTGEKMGRLTLNPLVHIDALGFLLLIVAGFGWGNPAPFNPYNLRIKNTKIGSALVAMAGPFSNLISVVIGIAIVRLVFPSLGQDNLLIQFLGFLIMINLMLMIFNLIPIPPLDGSKMLFGILPNNRVWQTREEMLERHGPWILLALIMLDSFGNIGIFHFIFQWAVGIVSRFS